MAAIDETVGVDKIQLPKAYLRTRIREMRDNAKECCCRRLDGSEADPLVEIQIAESDLYTFYPQLNLFMPKKEYLLAFCDSDHRRYHCEDEAGKAAKLAATINQNKSNAASVRSFLSSDNNFSYIVKYGCKQGQKDSAVKIFREKCSLGEESLGPSDNEFSSFVNDLYVNPNGTCIPVIELAGFDWKSVKSADSLKALLETGLEVKDQELAALMRGFCQLDDLLREVESDDVHWNDVVSISVMDALLAETLCQSESMRVNHQPLSAKVLTDPNQGHWDAWPVKPPEGFLEVSFSGKVYARNPLIDVDKAGVIGIDFGTKSTIVAKWSGGDTEVLRIGLDDFTKAPEPHHYENPTMMEFVDLEAFNESYAGTVGRPYTSWADLKTAHEARGDLDGLSSKDVELSQAFFSGLKQWAGYGDRKVTIADARGAECELVPYEELKPGDFDPIEIYAYHIGLAVNNMSGRTVVLKYLLSFPATFTLQAQTQILSSFERGIRRSLPQAVLEDAASMKSFRVEGGTSEPAAYAVCALKTLDLKPAENESIPYAVFDFGGGTTDFDFGLWRMSTEAECDDEDVDWVIEHFGSGGDAFLGGENILEDMAYLVYVANRDVIVTKKSQYPFAPPHDNAIKKETGYETLLVDSREGRMNRYRIAEKLRPLWEERSEAEKAFASGTVKVSLFDAAGGQASEVELRVETDRLEEFIRNRIASCVDSFFESLLNAFAVLDEKKKAQIRCPFHIFLAGNSSKSRHVRELMDERLKVIQKTSLEKVLSREERENVNMFRIHLPLGSEEVQAAATATQEGEGCAPESDGKSERVDFAHRPTGKTGVAFGLVESAPGRRIKVVDANKTASGETHFRYFVGRERRGTLVPLLNPESLGGGWVDFCPASKAGGISYLYYTRDGRGQTGDFPVKDAFRVRIEFEPTDGRVLIRASGVAEIEWCVGTVDKDGKGRPRKNEQPKKIQLAERN